MSPGPLTAQSGELRHREEGHPLRSRRRQAVVRQGQKSCFGAQRHRACTRYRHTGARGCRVGGTVRGMQVWLRNVHEQLGVWVCVHV